MTPNGRILRIFLRPDKKEPVQSVPSAHADLSSGLRGDHKKGGKRQITIMAREAWESACHQIGKTLDPGLRRANVLVEGVDLERAIGCDLVLGESRITLLGETEPCDRMDEAHPGLQNALQPNLRGGVFGRVVQAGRMSTDDPAYLIRK